MISLARLQKIIDDIGSLTGASLHLYEKESDPYGFLQTNSDMSEEDDILCFRIEYVQHAPLLLTAAGENAAMAGRLIQCELEHIAMLLSGPRDRAVFLKQLLLGELTGRELTSSSRRLHLNPEQLRGLFIIQTPPEALNDAIQISGAMYGRAASADTIALSEDRFALIHTFHETNELQRARDLTDTLHAELLIPVRTAYAPAARPLRMLAESCREAVLALTISGIFTPDTYVTSCDRLGIGRLVYSLPDDLCLSYLRETFGETDALEKLDPELLVLVNTYLARNLNISETAKSMFLHRNTLIYRLDKITQLTGLDLRRFEDAMRFRIALMVDACLKHRRAGRPADGRRSLPDTESGESL